MTRSSLVNLPRVRLALVGVSRDCFPVELTRRRLAAVVCALKERRDADFDFHPVSTIIENETHAMQALDEAGREGCNAAVLFLGNFGPETPTTIFAQRFAGPLMAVAAAEEDKAVLANDRGDALCGLLNCSYNLRMRNLRAYIPQAPVRDAKGVADEAAFFARAARVAVGVKNLKLFGFGPRPADFVACNAPIKQLYDLGVEVMENSELDLLALFEDAARHPEEIDAVADAMRVELRDVAYPDLLPKLARYEVALKKFLEANLGSRAFGAFANKCWPAFERFFRFVPCYVNARLAGQGYPVACEVDLYGALSEYMVMCATQLPATILDVNNSCPAEVVPEKTDLKGASAADLFMGFHCGNTCMAHLDGCAMKYQVIMNRGLEGARTPDITRGTLEGRLKAGPITFFRLQGAAEGGLRSYIAEGEILPVDPCTFGGTGVFAIPHFSRFYRHVLIGGGFPHHGAVGFAKAGAVLFEAVKMLGVDTIGVPLPPSIPYPGENPFARTFV